jgi:hypothetical protein
MVSLPFLARRIKDDVSLELSVTLHSPDFNSSSPQVLQQQNLARSTTGFLPNDFHVHEYSPNSTAEVLAFENTFLEHLNW